ncbi:MAG: hypothetical protein HOQ05_13370 [Corynebacteriales bacterium]|nr:hypothetical protein [Mycobacteriales bacterium]
MTTAINTLSSPLPKTSVNFKTALASEWTKFVSVRSTWWSTLSAFALMAGGSLILAMDFVGDLSEPQSVQDDPRTQIAVGEIAGDSTQLVQFATVALAMMVVTSEYSTGAIRNTLQADPNRTRLLIAKTAIIGAVTFISGILLGLIGILAAQAGLDGHGIWNTTDVTQAVFAIATYLSLVSMMTVGIAMALRSAVATLSTTLMLLLGMMMLLNGEIVHYTPGMAGSNFIRDNTTYYSRPAGIVIVAVWTLVTLGAGYVVLKKRDA